MNTAPLTVATAREGRSCILTITGDLDLTSAARLTAAVTGLVGGLNGEADRVVLDLAKLAFLDVTGARALLAAVHAVPGGHPVTVRSISPIASRLLGVLGWSLEAPGRAATPGGSDVRTPDGGDHDLSPYRRYPGWRGQGARGSHPESGSRQFDLAPDRQSASNLRACGQATRCGA